MPALSWNDKCPYLCWCRLCALRIVHLFHHHLPSASEGCSSSGFSLRPSNHHKSGGLLALGLTFLGLCGTGEAAKQPQAT